MPFTPHDAGEDTIRRARELLKLAETPGMDPSLASDLVRFSLVVGVAAVDTYLHRLVLTHAYEQYPLPDKLGRIPIPFASLLEMADRADEATKQGNATRHRVPAKRMLRDSLLRMTFQRFRDVHDALVMAGKNGNWPAITAHVAEPGEALTKAQLERRLNRIVDRRNAIVHEGDYRRLERPQNADREPVDPAQVESDLDFLERLIDAIHAV